MLGIDWRSARSYNAARSIPPAGFAWEYLRRHDEYHHDYQTIMRAGKPGMSYLETFSRRWGLRFPLRSRNTA